MAYPNFAHDEGSQGPPVFFTLSNRGEWEVIELQQEQQEEEQQQQNKAHVVQEHNSSQQLQFIWCTADPSVFLTLISETKHKSGTLRSPIQCKSQHGFLSLDSFIFLLWLN